MRISRWLLSSVLLSLVAASGQQTSGQGSVRSSDVSCMSYPYANGPYQCPNGSSCGTYVTYSGLDCSVEFPSCNVLAPTSFCCGKFPINTPSDPCLFTEMRDPHVRSRLLELAADNDILVPTCSGAYVPARIAFRGNKGKDNGGL
jgi:hypothetical protein